MGNIERYCLMKTEVGRNWYQSIHFDKMYFKNSQVMASFFTVISALNDQRIKIHDL